LKSRVSLYEIDASLKQDYFSVHPQRPQNFVPEG